MSVSPAQASGSTQAGRDRGAPVEPEQPPARGWRRRAVLARRYREAMPQRTMRLRLTALYGGLFLVSGIALLAITYLLVEGLPLAPAPKLPAACRVGQRADRDRLRAIGRPARTVAAIGSCAADHDGRVDLAGMGDGWTRAAPVACGHGENPRDLRGEPPRAACADGTTRRGHRAERHDRQAARPAGGSVRLAAQLCGECFARAAHAVGDDAHLA